jgi:hypothetical protein
VNYKDMTYHEGVTLTEFSNLDGCTIHGAVHSSGSTNYTGCVFHSAESEAIKELQAERDRLQRRLTRAEQALAALADIIEKEAM